MPSEHAIPDWPSLIVEGVDEARFSMDREWRFTYLNQYASVMLGQSREALLGRVMWEAFPSLIGGPFEHLYRQAMADGVARRLEDFSPTTQAWYDVRAYPIPQGLLIYFQDITVRKQLEQVAQENEYRFKVLSESSFEGIIIHQNGIIVEANQSAAQMFGYERLDELIGQSIVRLVVPEQITALQQRIASGVEGVTLSMALGVRKDESRFPIEARGRMIEYRGQLVRVVAIRDITELKEAEAKTQRQAERAQIQAQVSRVLAEVTHDYQSTVDTAARLLFEIIGDACLIRLLSPDGNTLELSAMYHPNAEAEALVREVLAEQQSQLLMEDLSGRVVLTGQPLLIPVVSIEQIKAITGPKQRAYFERFPVFSMLVTPLRAAGRVIGAISMTRYTPDRSYTEDDLTLVQDLVDRIAIAILNARLFQQVQSELAERVKIEEALRASEARFTGIVASAMDAIISIDGSLRIVVFNAAAEQMFGYAAAEMLGQPLDPLLPAPIQHLHAQYIRGFGRTGTTSRSMHALGTLVGIRADGEAFPIEATISQTFAVGQPLYTVIIHDITERTHAEETLRKTQMQLIQSQKMESMGQLAGGIAHDFNNLLIVILGYCDLILVGLQETDSLYTDVYEIHKAGNRAAKLVRQILAFSRQQILEPHVVNLNDLVANMDTLLHRVIGEDIELVSLLDPDLDVVLLDPGQVEQVIVNLAVNARDAMPEGGLLTIETANVDLDEHYHSAGHPDMKTGAYVMLAVSDTGIGMDQATQAKIFEPFFTTKALGKGTGLGLATVYGIVRQSEGSIWVYSEPGVGTTFKVYFPTIADLPLVPSQALPASQPQRSVVQSTTAHTGYGRTILVVEDDTLVQDLIHRVLVQAGYTILEASNGRVALDVLATYAHQVDVVLTDIVMPEMGGRALVERLKDEWADLKVLCMSGYTDRAVLRHGILRPCDTFLQKPFTPETLLRRIDEVMNNTDNQ